MPATIVLHSSTTDCGIACLQMVLAAHGVRATMADVRSVTRYSHGGVTVGNLVRTAKMFGLDGRAVRSELTGLSRLQLPAIMHWDFNHFVVLETVDRNGGVIVDPSTGRRRVGTAELSRCFTGVAVEFEPSSQPVSSLPRARGWSARPFAPTVERLRSLTALAVTVSLLSQLLTVLAPLWMASIIDNLETPGLLDSLPGMVAFIAIMITAAAAAEFVQREVLLRLGTLASISSSSKLVDHLFSLSYMFFGKRRINDLVSRVGHIRNIRDLIVDDGIPAVVDLVFAVVALIVLFCFSPLFGLICLTTIGAYSLLRYKMIGLSSRLTQDLVRADATEMGHLIENLRGVLTLKAANIEPERISIWQSALQTAANASVRLRRTKAGFASARFAVTYFDQLAVVAVGVLLVVREQLSLGVLFAVLLIRQQLYDRVLMLVDRAANLALIRMYVYRLSDVMEAEAALSWTSKAPHWSAAGFFPLRLNDLSFRYVENAPLVLDRVSLTIEPGVLIGIRGRSGEGKSTLMKLALGLMQPEAGSVSVGDNMLDASGFRALRERSGVVLQGEQLFSGTILENITWFGCDRDFDFVVECARAACIHEDIERLPMGYYSVVNDGVSNFSGGQIQRILLARAFYRRPDFLFLDEATSALDPALEADVVDAIQRLPSAKVCISHRSLILDRADIVYRMEEGGLALEADRRTSLQGIWPATEIVTSS